MNKIIDETNTLLDDTVREISDISAYSYETLSALPKDTLGRICYQFILDNGTTEKTYDIVHLALLVSLLSDIADLINVPIGLLVNLSYETKEIICGMYLMKYSDNGDNIELSKEIRAYFE